jgi:hypothetical protein
MAVSLSSELLLGMVAGCALTLLVQQLIRATSGIGRWLPLIGLILVLVAGMIWLTGAGH